MSRDDPIEIILSWWLDSYFWWLKPALCPSTLRGILVVEVLSTESCFYSVFQPIRDLLSSCLKLPSYTFTHTDCRILPPERSHHQSCLTHGARGLRNETSHIVVVPKMMKLPKYMGIFFNNLKRPIDNFPRVHAVSIELVSGIRRFSRIIWMNLHLRLFAQEVLKITLYLKIICQIKLI